MSKILLIRLKSVLFIITTLLLFSACAKQEQLAVSGKVNDYNKRIIKPQA